MKPFIRLCVLISAVLSFAPSSALASDIALDASIGALVPHDDFLDVNLDITGHLWWKYDQMVFLGGAGGMQIINGNRHFPALASLWLRLPFGGRTLPVAMGDMGYNFGDDPQFVWRAGAGLDIKNGNHSSLLVLGGFERFAKLGGFFYLRAGLLLEF